MKSFLFVESPVFSRRIVDLLPDDDYRGFQAALAANPELGDVIPGMAGLRKARLPVPGRGKRGGARVLYLVLPRHQVVYLLYVYTKNEIEDLPPDTKAEVRRWVEAIKKDYRP